MKGEFNHFNLKYLNASKETTSAIFIITVVSFFILTNFYAGFIFPFFIFSMVLGAAISFFYPRAGIFASIFLIFIFERFYALQPLFLGRSEFKLYPLDIIIFAVIAGIMAQILSGKIRLETKKADFYLISFIFLSFISFLISVFVFRAPFESSFSSFKHYAFYPLLYFVFVMLFQQKENLILFFKFIFAGALGILFFLGYGVLNGRGLWTEFTPLSTEGTRLLAFTHAFYLSLAFIGLFAWLVFEKTKKNFLYLMLLILWTIGIVGSMMRHLWIGLFVAIIAFCVIVPKLTRKSLGKLFKSYILFFIVFAVTLFYFLTLLPNSNFADFYDSMENFILQRIESFLNATNDESFLWRSVVWKEGLDQLLKNPLWGVGLGKSIYVEIGKYKDFVEIRNLHNSFLVVLIQMGFVVFAIFALFIAAIFQEIYSKKGKNWMDYALLSAGVFYLVVSFFQPYLETNMLAVFFWIILGLMRSSNQQK